MATYRIGSTSIDASNENFTRLLAQAHENKWRPLCTCTSEGVPMYISKVNGHYIIKRMPDSGAHHSSECDSYEPPAELSGLGQVLGAAIQEDVETSLTSLKFDFSLTKVNGRGAPTPGDSEKDSVKSTGTKLSLRALLHFLWDEARFSHWSPNMAGKRSWYVIRKHLLEAIANKVAKGSPLKDFVYIPEPFQSEHQAEIAQRRLHHFMKFAASNGGTKRLMLFIGEVKGIEKSQYGFKIVLKQVPENHFMMTEALHSAMEKRFAIELDLWRSQGSKLVAIGTCSISPSATPNIEELTLMPVTENWIPFDSLSEKMMVDQMTLGRRRFIKGLRYNLPRRQPLATLVATDTKPIATAMYLLPQEANEEYRTAAERLIDDSKIAKWIWDQSLNEGMMPPLPAIQLDVLDPVFE